MLQVFKMSTASLAKIHAHDKIIVCPFMATNRCQLYCIYRGHTHDTNSDHLTGSVADNSKLHIVINTDKQVIRVWKHKEKLCIKSLSSSRGRQWLYIALLNWKRIKLVPSKTWYLLFMTTKHQVFYMVHYVLIPAIYLFRVITGNR